MTDQSITLARIDTIAQAIENADPERLSFFIRQLDAIRAQAAAKKMNAVAKKAAKWSNEARRKLGVILKEMPKNPGVRMAGNKSGNPAKIVGGAKKEPPTNIPTLADLGITKKESALLQKLADVDSQVWDTYQAKVEAGETGVHLSGIIGSNLSSLGEEYYTPADYIAAAKGVMGDIDLDPASIEEANRTVGAKEFYSSKENGISKTWRGRVFLNPPYGEKIAPFMEKLRSEMDAGNVSEAIVLVFYKMETEWAQLLFRGVLCFPRGRVNFFGPGSKKCAPTLGSVLVYFGPNEKGFAKAFSAIGNIVRRWPDGSKEHP